MISAEELQGYKPGTNRIKEEGRRALEQFIADAQATGEREVKLPLNFWSQMKMGYYLNHGGIEELISLGYDVEVLKTVVKIGW